MTTTLTSTTSRVGGRECVWRGCFGCMCTSVIHNPEEGLGGSFFRFGFRIRKIRSEFGSGSDLDQDSGFGYAEA